MRRQETPLKPVSTSFHRHPISCLAVTFTTQQINGETDISLVAVTALISRKGKETPMKRQLLSRETDVRPTKITK